MADWEGIPERERRQMEEILQLDMEELNVEVVDDNDEEEEEVEGHGSEEDDDVDAFLRCLEGHKATAQPFLPSTPFVYFTLIFLLQHRGPTVLLCVFSLCRMDAAYPFPVQLGYQRSTQCS